MSRKSKPALELHHGNALDVLASMPENSIDCVMTSPPYWGLRDYGLDPTPWPEVSYLPIPGLPEECAVLCKVPAQTAVLGLERRIEDWVAHIVLIFREVRRVLKPKGTCWVNLGDSYFQSGGAGWQGEGGVRSDRRFTLVRGQVGFREIARRPPSWISPKNLMAQPWRAALALQADGWILRQDVIWRKPNPMPESTRDRCTKAHEYLFLLTKEPRYHWNKKAMEESVSGGAHARCRKVAGHAHGSGSHSTIDHLKPGAHPKTAPSGSGIANNSSLDHALCKVVERRNRRSVWTVAPEPTSEHHFAAFPKELVKPCVLAGCPPGGVVLDPFAGTGTVGATAIEQGRRAVLVEMQADYIPIIRRRCSVQMPLMAPEALDQT